MGGRWPLLGSLRVRCLATLIDRLGRRDDLSLEWASAAFRDDERCRRGELPEDNSSSASRSISPGIATSLPLLGREGGKRRGGSRDCSAWLPTGFVGARFLLTTDSSVRAVQPSV